MLKKFYPLILFLFFSTLVNGQTFTEIIKVIAGDREEQDRFGWSVAISGNYAIVGAYGDDFGASDPNMGSAYIFEKTGIADWTFVQKIFNSDQDDYDRFGWSVAIDGDIAVIGAYAEDHDVSDGAPLSSAGSVYVFERDGGGVWNQTQKIVPSDREAGDEFGWSVAISGSTLIVGSHYDNEDEDDLNYMYHAGSAYIFDRLGDGTWIQSQKIVGSGRSVDIDFPDGGGGAEDLSDQFGCDVDIHGDKIIVGSYHHDYDALGGSPIHETGTAYIFERSLGTWSEVAKLQNSDRALEDRFGWSVGIDGNIAIVGAYTEDENEAGASTLANAGSVYLFERDGGGTWSQIQKIVPSDRANGDRFGYDLSIDGETFIVGAIRANTDALGAGLLSDAGAAYTYAYDLGTDTWIMLNKLDASDRQIDDQLGVSVCISSGSAIVGAHQQSFNLAGADELIEAGAAYFYTQEVCEPSSSSQTLELCAGQSVDVGPFNHDATGMYVDVLFTEDGCDSTVTTNLTILPTPFSSQSVSICFGYPYEIGGSSYTESGVYTDTVSTPLGCDSIVHTTLTVSPENAVSQDITICWGESYTIGASTYTIAGSYTDILTSEALCDSTITTNLVVQLPVNKAINQTLNLLSAELEGGSYQWIKCNPYEIIPGATSQSYVAPIVGEYAVIVTEGECSDTSSCVYVDILQIEEVENSLAVSIYPNPSSGLFTVRLNTINSGSYILSIYNDLGQCLDQFESNEVNYSFQLDNYKPGIYVIQVTSEQSSATQRIIIQ
jgi:hypothetical protein